MIGAVTGLVAKKDNTVSGLLNVITIVVCFFGGCYIPLTFIKTIPIIGSLTVLSPIYWINVAIGSVFCNIETNAFLISISYSLIGTFVLLILFIAALRKKGGIANA